jgi:hypothetical protein
MLEDDHEWYVVTDMHLKIIAAGRGIVHHIPENVIEEVYLQVLDKLRSIKSGTIRVYDLHTHPGDHIYPSPGDLGRSVWDRFFNGYGMVHAGHGVITKKGILIWKLPANQKKLAKMENIKNVYIKKVNESSGKYFGQIQPDLKKELIALDEKTTMHGPNKIINRVGKEAFRSVQETEPGIRTRMVRRNTFRTRVR